MTNRPIENFHAGNVEVAVWENRGEDSKIFHGVTAKRTYRDGNGDWKDAGTIHLLPQQIPDLLLALQKSHEFLRMGLRQKSRQQAGSPREETIDKEATEQDTHSATEERAAESMVKETPDDGESKRARKEGFTEKVASSRGAASRSH